MHPDTIKTIAALRTEEMRAAAATARIARQARPRRSRSRPDVSMSGVPLVLVAARSWVRTLGRGSTADTLAE